MYSEAPLYVRTKLLLKEGLIETIPRVCGDSVDLAIIRSLSIYGCRPSANSFCIRTRTYCPQSTRKCCFNSFCVVVAVVDRIQAVFVQNLSFRSYTSLESALIVQTAQKVSPDKLSHKPNA